MFVLAGALTLCFLPPAGVKEKDVEDLQNASLLQNADSIKTSSQPNVGILQGMKNCFYLLTTPKFILLTFTMFANGVSGY